MEKDFSIPPKDPRKILSSKELIVCLKNLIGKSFKITGKPRTDGSTIRKLVTECLVKYSTCTAAKPTDYEIIPPRKKGLPRLIGELLDTYIVTSGTSYNLQVWNRFPNSKSALVEYNNGKTIRSCDIRLVLIKIDVDKSIIESITILTPSYIVNKFGLFGTPTIKHQIIISENKRKSNQGHVLLGNDTDKMISVCRNTYTKPIESMTDFPKISKPFSIKLLSKIVAKKLIGEILEATDTKNRGQILERKVMELLGYNDHLVGGYPDIPNQFLEVKVQDSPTVDLGKYSPEFEDIIFSDITTKDVRYLIALTNVKTNIIESIVLVSGNELGDIFTFVSDTSFKCQRSIPMSFFAKHRNKCVFNP